MLFYCVSCDLPSYTVKKISVNIPIRDLKQVDALTPTSNSPFSTPLPHLDNGRHLQHLPEAVGEGGGGVEHYHGAAGTGGGQDTRGQGLVPGVQHRHAPGNALPQAPQPPHTLAGRRGGLR